MLNKKKTGRCKKNEPSMKIQESLVRRLEIVRNDLAVVLVRF